MEKDKRVMEASRWQRLIEGATGSCSDRRGMLSKSLIQFSVDGWGCVPSLLFTWGQTVVEVMKILATSFRRSQACTATLSAPNPAAGHHDPRLCWRLLDIHRQVWVSLFWVPAPFSWVLVHKVLFVPSKNLLPSPVQVLAALWWG